MGILKQCSFWQRNLLLLSRAVLTTHPLGQGVFNEAPSPYFQLLFWIFCSELFQCAYSIPINTVGTFAVINIVIWSVELAQEIFEPIVIVCSQPEAFDVEKGLQVQLLPNYNIWVSKSKLQLLLKEATSLKEGAQLYVLRRLIPLVFTWEELAASRGQGLNCKSTDDVLSKDPLDPTKVLVCKGSMVYFLHLAWNRLTPQSSCHKHLIKCFIRTVDLCNKIINKNRDYFIQTGFVYAKTNSV